MTSVDPPLSVAVTVEQLWQPVPGGSGSYVRELLTALAARGDVAVVGISAAHRGSAADGLLDVPVAASRLPRRALYDAWNVLGAPRAEDIARRGVDVVHATTWAVPPTRRPLVVTVHDLAFLHDPEHFTARGVRFFRRSWHRVRAEATAVVVPSKVTAADCVAHGMDEARLHVVPHGVRVSAISPSTVTAVRKRYGLERPYVLWTGTREPRKNLDRLVAAFAAVRDRRPDLDLVLVGPRGWGDDVEGAPGVRVLGRLSHEDLHAAYAAAEVFCYPSLREGFGLPVLEAMAHGTPVVTSQGSPMAEVTGDGEAGILVDPLDVDAIAAGLLDALDRREVLSAAASRRARAYTWEAAAAATVRVYDEASGRPDMSAAGRG